MKVLLVVASLAGMAFSTLAAAQTQNDADDAILDMLIAQDDASQKKTAEEGLFTTVDSEYTAANNYYNQEYVPINGTNPLIEAYLDGAYNDLQDRIFPKTDGDADYADAEDLRIYDVPAHYDASEWQLCIDDCESAEDLYRSAEIDYTACEALDNSALDQILDAWELMLGVGGGN